MLSKEEPNTIFWVFGLTTWDLTLDFRTCGELPTHYDNDIYIFIWGDLKIGRYSNHYTNGFGEYIHLMKAKE